jgi:hypothetical protein
LMQEHEYKKDCNNNPTVTRLLFCHGILALFWD